MSSVGHGCHIRTTLEEETVKRKEAEKHSKNKSDKTPAKVVANSDNTRHEVKKLEAKNQELETRLKTAEKE